MKLTKWIGVLLIGASLLVAGCSSEQPKVGTVDTQKIVSESKVGVEATAKVQAQMEALEEEMKKMVKIIILFLTLNLTKCLKTMN